MSRTVAACQLALADLDVEANLSAVESRVRELSEDVAVALFPEYALTGFVADGRAADVALARDGPEIDRVARLARDSGTALVVGFVERAADGDAEEETLYNATAYVAPGGTRAFYRKRHLWEGERELLEAGTERVVVDTPVGSAGILTCYDLNFVEESAAFTREGVDALFVVGAWPGAYSENWTLLLRARALDGVRWVVGAGRTGRRDLPGARSVTYAGRSLVARPDGGVHAALDRREDDLVAELDSETLAAQRDLVGIYDGESRTPSRRPDDE
ncbi:carbon-nitrogen hydrolase family protein [Halobellus rarus]|uniref:Carbon-nitrogen hydrolase family protein n=1 Tax=Halobellus rarus TaxID=1126237 RepID=A0ABD6CL53_9EURY|nr:carbon-nitrogen hydrolase family protein [Halobellus rarus]